METASTPRVEGRWRVERRGGLLPPMPGMVKEINQAEGVTRVGRLRVPFEVRGLELHYRGPARGLVDVLRPEGEGFAGRAVFRGREIGRFALARDDR